MQLFNRLRPINVGRRGHRRKAGVPRSTGVFLCTGSEGGHGKEHPYKLNLQVL